MPLVHTSNIVRFTAGHDWVVYCILAVAFLMIFTITSLNRGISVRNFLIQTHAEAANHFLTWLLTGIGFTVMIAVFVSQSIPFVPKNIAGWQLFGLELNKMGYALLVFCSYFFSKAVLSFFLYAGIGQEKRWQRMYFVSSRFYAFYTILIMCLCLARYFFPIDLVPAFPYFMLAFCVIFSFKILFLFFHRERVLPEEWYYKILYICTLQIAPLLVLWKALFL